MVRMLERTLTFGPATVLTNGTVLRDEWLARLQAAEARSPFSLEFRVSIDGFTAADNDRLRGPGAFERALDGVRRLLAHGFMPVITAARTRDDQDDAQLFHGFVGMLRGRGYDRPRVKILPTLRIGAEATRDRAYRPEERVRPEMMDGFDVGQLLCHHARILTDRGVFVCPILIEAPDARQGATLAESLGPFPLRHHACYTCYQYGALCSNAASAGRDA